MKNLINKGASEERVKFCHSIFFYFPWLLKEMLISSFEVAKLVFTPKKIDPKIVCLKTKIKGNAGRVILANSITLTPGTFTIDVEKDYLLVHCLVAPQEEESQMEKKVRGLLC